MASNARPLYSKRDVNRAGQLWARYMTAWLAHRDDVFRETDIAATDVIAADKVLEWWRAEHAYPLRIVNANLRHYVRDVPDARVTQRLKKHSTMINKLTREPQMKLSQMEDIGGCRVRLPDQTTVNQVVRRLKKNWRIHRHRDYVARPRSSGYRAHHLIVERRGRRIEVQLRTPRQDFWANTVEYDSRVTRDDLKSGAGPALAHDYYVAMAEFLAFEDKNQPPPGELRERLSALYDEVGTYLAGRTPPPGF
jgi:putative GTP pyrophosphokinase